MYFVFDLKGNLVSGQYSESLGFFPVTMEQYYALVEKDNTLYVIEVNAYKKMRMKVIRKAVKACSERLQYSLSFS
jgi:hypothetical protein